MSLHLLLVAIDPERASGPHEIDPAKVRLYAEAMRRGDRFPPIRAVDYGDSLMIIDGHHRAAAARIANTPLSALVAQGEDFEDLDLALRDAGAGRADDPEHWQ
jgi:ParB-like chromosome segregation protein Spo0J